MLVHPGTGAVVAGFAGEDHLSAADSSGGYVLVRELSGLDPLTRTERRTQRAHVRPTSRVVRLVEACYPCECGNAKVEPVVAASHPVLPAGHPSSVGPNKCSRLAICQREIFGVSAAATSQPSKLGIGNWKMYLSKSRGLCSPRACRGRTAAVTASLLRIAVR